MNEREITDFILEGKGPKRVKIKGEPGQLLSLIYDKNRKLCAVVEMDNPPSPQTLMIYHINGFEEDIEKE